MSESLLRKSQATLLARAGFYGPLIVFLAISALAFAFTAQKQRERSARLGQRTAETADAVARLLEDETASQISLVQRLRDMRVERAFRDVASADSLAAAYAELFGLAALARLTPSGAVVRVAPLESNSSKLFDESVAQDPVAAPFFLRAHDEQTDIVTPAMRLATGGWGFAGYFPVVREGKVEAVLGAYFRFTDLLDRTVDAATLTDFNILLRDDDNGQQIVYERWRGDRAAYGELEGASKLRIAGHRYVVEALPGAVLVAETWDDIWFERLGGFLLAAVIAFSSRQMVLRSIALQRRDQVISGLLAGLPLTVFRLDARGVLVEARGKGAEALGLDRYLGRAEFGREPAELARAIEIAGNGGAAHCEVELGDSFFDVSVLPDVVHRGEVVGFAHDVTSRHQAEAALRRSEGHYRGFFQEAPFGYLVADAHGVIALANLEAARLFRRSEKQLIGRQLIDVFGAGKKDRVAAAQLLDKVERGEEIRDQELRLTRQDGKPFWCSLSVQTVYEEGSYAGGRFVLFDITRRKELEERLRQSGKMEAVGRLAGGITHDFNNLLTAIMGFARLALGRLPAGSPLERDLGEIEKAGKRATELVSRLLTFSRQQPSEARVVELNARVRDLAAMLRRLVREDIELELRLGEAGSLRIDPAQLEQVLVNLVVNGMEAIKGRGHIVIETTTYHPTGKKPQCRVRVIDDGRGMTAEVQEHLFEPFFTTKAAEEGSGLGLATVYGIVEHHSGEILVDSEPGLGTTVTVLFPQVPNEERPRLGPTTVSLPPSGKERVLVVEDEQQVREMAQEMLEILGYQVLSARDGRQAIELMAGRESEVDLLLSDVVMPHVGGEQLYRTLKARHPGLRVLFTSGYTDDPFIRSSVEAGELPFLQKPYTLDTLAIAMRAALRESV